MLDDCIHIKPVFLDKGTEKSEELNVERYIQEVCIYDRYDNLLKRFFCVDEAEAVRLYNEIDGVITSLDDFVYEEGYDPDYEQEYDEE